MLGPLGPGPLGRAEGSRAVGADCPRRRNPWVTPWPENSKRLPADCPHEVHVSRLHSRRCARNGWACVIAKSRACGRVRGFTPAFPEPGRASLPPSRVVVDRAAARREPRPTEPRFMESPLHTPCRRRPAPLSFRPSRFGFPSNFGLRTSDFDLLRLAPQRSTLNVQRSTFNVHPNGAT